MVSADFEIAFSATLATVVLTTLSGEQIPIFILKLISVALIFITLIRRMAVGGRFTNETKLLSLTMPLIEFLTILVVFHLFYAPARFIVESTTLLPDPFILMALIIPESIILLIVLQELTFKNYMIWWSGFTFGKAISAENTVIRSIGGLTSFFAFRASLVEDVPEELDGIQKYVNEVADGTTTILESLELDIPANDVIRTSQAGVFILVSGVFLAMVLLLAYALSFVIGTFSQLFLLLFSVFFIRHFVRFYYLAYGLPHEGHVFHQSALLDFGILLVYIISVYFLFS